MSGNKKSLADQHRPLNGESSTENHHDLDIGPIYERRYWSSANILVSGRHWNHNICPVTKYQWWTNAVLSTASRSRKSPWFGHWTNMWMEILGLCKHALHWAYTGTQHMSDNKISAVDQHRDVNGEPPAENRHDFNIGPICERQYRSSANMPASGRHRHHNIYLMTKYHQWTNTGLLTASLQQKSAMISTLDQYINANIGTLPTSMYWANTEMIMYVQ